MNFIKKVTGAFTDLNDSQTPIYSAERTTTIKSLRCCNKSGVDIRIYLQYKSLLKDPIEEAFILYNRLLLANQTMDLLSVVCGNTSEIVEKTLLDGDNLICYSDDFSHKFDLSLDGEEETELNDVI